MALQFPLQFKRQYSGPIDVDQVFATIADKNAYLNNPLRYAGMAITCLEEEGKLFILNNDLTSWIELSVDLSGYVTTDNLEVLALLKANAIPLLSLSPESPILPEVNDCFYQEDVKTIFKWNGTSWLPIVDPEDYLYQYNGKQYKWNSALGLVGVGVGLSTNDYTDTDKQALANKVDKETGKGLSTNDYNDTEANKFALKDNLVNTFTGATVDQFPNALLVKNELESLTTQITRVYKPMGELQAIDIKPSLLDADHLGFVYNINGDFVTTTDFIEGAGKTHSSGSNIVIIEITGTYMFDVMSGMIDLSGYVEKETGKGLSANDFTTTLKNKLDGAEETSNKVNTLEDATVDKYPNALLVKNIIETLNSGLASVQNLSPFVYKGLIGTSYATSMNDILKTYEQYDSINSYWQFRPIKGSVYICNADIVFPLNEIYNWVGVAKNSQTAYSTSEHGVGTDITTLTLKKGDALVITDFFYNPDAPYDISAYIKLERNIDTSVFVQKDGTKVLSDNNFTTTLKDKLDGAEITSNKVIAWSETTNDTRYPSEKLVKDYVDSKVQGVSDLSPYHYEGTFVGGDALQNDFDNLIVGFEDLREGYAFNETKLQGSYFVCSADSAFYFNTTYHWSAAAGTGKTSAITYTWAAPYDLNGLTEINMKAGDIISILDFSYNAGSNTISTLIKVEKNPAETFVLKNGTITGATNTKITYDAKGLVTAGDDLTADDIPAHQHTKSEITDFPTIPANKSYSKTITTANWVNKKYAVTISGLVVSDTVLLSGADDIFTTNGLTATITANTLTFEVETLPTVSIDVNFTVIKTEGGTL